MANLIGVDFGSSFIKATLVRPGKKFEIVENTASKRKTENMITLGPENRLYGVDALMESGKQPKNTFGEFQRLFGQKFDSDIIQEYKKNRFVTNDFVADQRGLIGFKVHREGDDQVLNSEEMVGMMLQYIRYLAEKMSGERVDECVITVPSWYTYDQRLMVREAAQSFAEMTVLQLVHENTAAAVLFGIDKVKNSAQNYTVLIYNMGGMDTEVTIARYSHLKFTEEQKKETPYMEILAESYVKDMGSVDMDLVMVNILADKFNSLKDREGKDDVRNNVRALKRLQKEAIKIKEMLSANKFASVKIPELLDYVTLEFILERTEFEAALGEKFNRVMDPVHEALATAGLTLEEIDQVELLGGGIRTPKVLSILEQGMPGKELGVHLNGDEAMCFGSAFIGSNSTTSFKVGKVLLTQNPTFDVKLALSPLWSTDARSEEDQKSEGLEEADLIQYNQELRLFNTSDYYGKSKAMTMNYDADMKLELYKIPKGAALDTEEAELLETFKLDDLKNMYKFDFDEKTKEQEREKDRRKKKAEKAAKKNETEGEDKKEETPAEEEKEEELKPIEKPKLRFSIELSRSGYFKVNKATIGGSFLSINRVRKDSELGEQELKDAKSRLKAYRKKDEDKQRNDIARNDFESLVYKVREWLREEENEVYVESSERENRIEFLNEMEDWLYEDGANANYTILENKTADLTKEFTTFTSRKTLHETLDAVVKKARDSVAKIEDKVNTLKEDKPFITEEERNDVTDTGKDLLKWVDEQLEKQSKLAKHDTPVFKTDELSKKLKKFVGLYTKVSNKKAPKPKKEKKKKEDKPADDEKTEEKPADEKPEEPTTEETKEESKADL